MPKSKPDPWHFARPELAEKYLRTFQIGLISAQALFAPRRMGKSEFLEQDLIPAAQKSGLLTAYLNLWDAREHPRGALIGALARAASPTLAAEFAGGKDYWLAIRPFSYTKEVHDNVIAVVKERYPDAYASFDLDKPRIDRSHMSLAKQRTRILPPGRVAERLIASEESEHAP